MNKSIKITFLHKYQNFSNILTHLIPPARTAIPYLETPKKKIITPTFQTKNTIYPTETPKTKNIQFEPKKNQSNRNETARKFARHTINDRSVCFGSNVCFYCTAYIVYT